MFNLVNANPIPGYFNPPNFLPIFYLEDWNNNEYSTYDTKKRFEDNLKAKGNKWHYARTKVYYNNNKDGYRAPEWNTVDWANSVVVFGCSNVTGIGLAEEETITSQLSKMINRPVINLGAPSTSIDFSFFNSLILAEKYPTPYAVVHLWTSIDRFTRFRQTEMEHLGIWNYEKDNFYTDYVSDTYQTIMNGKMISMASRNLWKDKSRYYAASFFDITAHYMECDRIEVDNEARDLLHPGRLKAAETAQLIAENIT